MSVEKELGRYRLLDRLGQGGMATVYRAHDPQLGRDVAVKVMHPFIAEKSEAARRFEREARAVAGLRHPNVLLLHDYQPAEGERPAYLVMELLSGPSLRTFLEQHGTPFAEVGAIIGLRVAQALEAAHAADLVHRDVKPENVMFDCGSGGNRVVLCDFGIARLAVSEGGHTLTATGAVIGSPVFMSPEQARGDTTDARSDLFSLGSLLYNLATGVPPFLVGGATQPLAIMSKIARGEHPPPMAKNPRVPRWLERIIERCLKVDPAERFPSATAVIAALSEGLRADGLGDFDGELAAYLRDPPGYNEKLPARLVTSTLGQMRDAVAGKQRARALTAASRILAWEPAQAEALAVVDKFEPRSRRWWLAAAALVALVAAGGGWVLWHRPRNLPKPQPLVESAAVSPQPLVETVVASPQPIAEKVVVEMPRQRRRGKIAALEPPPEPPPPEPPPPEPPKPEEPPKPGTLTVAITPWCDLTVDGKARGRAPMTLQLPAGPHQVDCRQPSGAAVRRVVTLEPGGTEVLREQLYAARISPQFRQFRGAEFAVDEGAPSAGAREAPAGRHKITLYWGGKIADSAWVDVRPEGCRLVDKPELACEKP
jgi:serine/threonine-protein kinase